MNITEKLLFNQEIQNNNLNLSEISLLFLICYIIMRILYYFSSSYTNL